MGCVNADDVCLNGSLGYECQKFRFVKTSAIHVVLNGNIKFEFELCMNADVASVRESCVNISISDFFTVAGVFHQPGVAEPGGPEGSAGIMCRLTLP